MRMLVIFAAKYLYLLVVAAAGVYWLLLARKNKLRFALQLLATMVLAFALVKLLNALWYDPRPFVVDGVAPLIAHAADNGFPSEHTTYSMAIALVVLLWSWRWGSVLFILAAVVGRGRVAAHVHSVRQVIAGVVVAAVAVAVVYGVMKLFYKPKPEHSRTEEGLKIE